MGCGVRGLALGTLRSVSRGQHWDPVIGHARPL